MLSFIKYFLTIFTNNTTILFLFREVVMTKIVEVCQGMMGVGKSSAIFKWIDDNPNEKYIYVSPNLSEVDVNGRIHGAVSKVEFHSPTIDDSATKLEDLNKLLNQGKSVACTHNLYLSMNHNSMDLISRHGYIVILDEEINVMKSYKQYSFKDIVWLMQEGYIKRDDKDGSVIWLKEDDLLNDREHSYFFCKNLCDKKSLYLTRFDIESKTAKQVMMVTQIPIKLIECAKRCIAVTYMFEGSVLDCFLRLKGFDVVEFKDVKLPNKKPSDIKHLITLVPPDAKTKKFAMTSTWWETKALKQDVLDIQNYILRNARKYAETPDKLLWTSPKGRAKSENKSTRRELLNPIGFNFYKDSTTVGDKDVQEKKPCWISAKTRATNDYANKTVMIQCYNRYPLHDVASYLQDYGYPVNPDRFCISEVTQWFFRGCIRNNEPMVWCCANKRVYDLLVKWLNGEFD